jgi:hypothetical protein
VLANPNPWCARGRLVDSAQCQPARRLDHELVGRPVGPPRLLPRLDYSDGIPEQRAMVVVATMLTARAALKSPPKSGSGLSGGRGENIYFLY